MLASRTKIRRLRACVEHSVADEACDNRGFDGDDFARVVALGDPFIWHAIQYVHRGWGAIREAGELRPIRIGVVERCTKSLAAILLADTTGIFEF